jgi:PIN domain nuclease of toxin-antitoxin system
VNLLLDTHAVLWWLAGARLEERAEEAIRDPATRAAVSAASVWETAIKTSLGKLRSPAPFAEAVLTAGFEALPVTFEHAQQVRELPPHHRDPFDRMLVAQAQLEGLTIVTRDPIFDAYGVPVLRC